MTKTVTDLIRYAKAHGAVDFQCRYGAEVDYQGTNEHQIIDALNECDEMVLVIVNGAGVCDRALVVMGNDEDWLVDYTLGGIIEAWDDV